MEQITIKVRSNDIEFLEKIFKKESPSIHSNAVITEQFNLTCGSIKSQPGMISQEFIVELVINFSLGLTASILGAWLYEKIGNKGENSIKIENRPEEVVFEQEIIEEISLQVKRIKKTKRIKDA